MNSLKLKKVFPWLISILAVILTFTGLYFFTDIFQNRQVDVSNDDLAKYFKWQVLDETLDEQQIDRFYQRFLTAKSGLEENSDLFAGWLGLGEAKNAVGDYAGARDAWEHLSEIRPLNSLSFGNLAALYTYDIYNPEKAEFNYLKAIENSKGEPFNINYYRNYFEFQLYFIKDKSRAEEILLEGIKANPEDADLPSRLASFYADEERIEDAIKYYELSLERNGDNEVVKQEIDRLKKSL